MNPKREVELVGRRLELTDAMRSRVEEMASKLHEHDANVDRIKVELERERHSATHADEFMAKGQVDDGREHHLASAKGVDLYRATSELESKLDRLIRRASRRRGAARRQVRSIDLQADLPKVN